MQTILLLKSAFLCVSRFFGLSSFDTVTTLILSRLASFLPFFEVIPEILDIFVKTNNPKLLSMKASLFYTGLISLCSMIFSSCGVGIPIQNKAPQNNDTYTISYLFEHDGVKVYRFYDMGNYVYFTTKGEVTSINNDSTAQRTIVVPKDNLIIAPKETGK